MWHDNSSMTDALKSKRGPKPKPAGEVREHGTLRLFPRHWEKIDAAGKAEFEALLEAWQPKTKKPAK